MLRVTKTTVVPWSAVVNWAAGRSLIGCIVQSELA